jgi:predicted amino acid racemase
MDLFDAMCRRNPELVRAAAALHASGELPPDCYVADLDSILSNARLIIDAANAAGIEILYETKQFARSAAICSALAGLGLQRAMAVDIEELYALERLNVRIGHAGHLGQLPQGDIEHVVRVTRPDYITVFSYEKAAYVARVAADAGLNQNIVLRVNGRGDYVPKTLTGGTPEGDVVAVIDAINRLDGVRFVGFTTYPAIRFDLQTQEWRVTPNFETMLRVAAHIEQGQGIEVTHINPAGNVCVASLPLLANTGATHCEPGQAFVGGLVGNAFRAEPEVPALAYVTEVTHFLEEVPYVYAPSMVANATTGIWHTFHYDSLGAGVSHDGGDPITSRLQAPPQVFTASDPTYFMYGALHPTAGTSVRVGDTVVFGFRTQLYRTNGGKLAVVEGVQRGAPTILEICDRNGVKHDRTGPELMRSAAGEY